MPCSNHANVQHDVNGICKCIPCTEHYEEDLREASGYAEFVFRIHNLEGHEPTFKREPGEIIHPSGHISTEDEKYMKMADDFHRRLDGKGRRGNEPTMGQLYRRFWNKSNTKKPKNKSRRRARWQKKNPPTK